MVVNDDAYCLKKCVVLEFIASKLAPTEGWREASDRHRRGHRRVVFVAFQ